MFVLEFKIPDDKGGIVIFQRLRDETLRVAAMIRELGDEYTVGNGKAEMLNFAKKLERAANALQ